MDAQHEIPADQANAIAAELLTRAPDAPPAPSAAPEQTDEQRAARAAELEEATAKYLRDARRWDNRVRWENSCPPALQTSDWARPELAPFAEPIQRVLAYQIGPKGILASGPTGRGKTRAMWQLMRRLGEEGWDVRFWSASDWFTSLQDNIRYGRDEARGWVESAARHRVVFIDDLGQEAVTTAREDWAQSWFFRFLDIRVGERLPLFVTTNLKANEMSGRSGSVRGDPLVRRLLEIADPIPFETASERAQREAISAKNLTPVQP